MATARRDAGSGSVYQLHNHPTCPPAEAVVGKNGKSRKVRPPHRCQGSWRASVDVGYVYVGKGENGEPMYKRDRKPVRGRTKAEVVAKLKELQGKKDSGAAVTTRVPKAGDWLTRWISEIRPHQRTRSGPIRPKTLQRDRTNVERYLVPFFGRRGLDEIERRPAMVLEFHKWMRAKSRERGKGAVEEATVLRAHATLSKALEDAKRLEGFLKRNPCKEVDQPGNTGKEVAFLDAAGAAALLEHDRDGRWWFALLTGKRRGERLGLRWSHVDLDHGTADVSWQLQQLGYRHGCGTEDVPRCGRRFGGNCPARTLEVPADYPYVQLDGALCLTRPKTHRHLIPLVPSLVDRLRRRRETVEPGRHDLVWARDDGRPIDPHDDYDEWYATLSSLGLPRVRPHSARHTCATTLLSLGVPETIIMQLVGHSTLVAARKYLHADLDAARAAAVKLGRALGVEPPELSTGNDQP